MQNNCSFIILPCSQGPPYCHGATQRTDINSIEVVDTGVNKDQQILAADHTQSISAVDYILGKSSAVVGEFSANAANLLGRSKACRASCLS